MGRGGASRAREGAKRVGWDAVVGIVVGGVRVGPSMPDHKVRVRTGVGGSLVEGRVVIWLELEQRAG